MIEVHQEPGSFSCLENCCFCRKPTSYWTGKEASASSVACCFDCARFARPQDIPAKADWCRREGIAMHAEGMPAAHSANPCDICRYL